jgi:hypothetical protein
MVLVMVLTSCCGVVALGSFLLMVLVLAVSDCCGEELGSCLLMLLTVSS